LAALPLALGIGVNVAIFSALEALVLNPLPFANADRLMAVYEDSSWIGYPKNTPAPGNFFDWRRESKNFEDMAATSGCRAVLTGEAAPEEVRCRSVMANLWPMLGVPPIAGRWFNDEEDHPQPDVAVIGEGLWARRWGRDPQIVNHTVLINGRGYKIVGIMPVWFRFGGDMELWLPIGFSPEQKAARNSHYLTTYGKLKPGATVQQADAELKGIQARINRLYPKENNPLEGARTESLRDALVGDVRPALWTLMAAAGTVLLIACANVASLLLAHATARQREFATRAALGSSASGLFREVFGEALFIAMIGGSAGIALALLSRRVLEMFIPPAMKGTVAISLDARVFAFALLATLLAALIAAATPFLQLLRAPLVSMLRQDSRVGLARGTARLRAALVVAEVAMTVALLSGAGLMVRSLAAIWQTDLGFHPEHLWTARVSLPNLKYPTDDKKYQFYDLALEKLRAIPGVSAVAFASTPPFFSIGNSQGFAIEGRTSADTWENSDMLTRVGTPSYLQTIGATLVSGRYFTDADREGALDVAIVNESFQRTFFPAESAIGKRMSLTGPGPPLARRWRTIVGVVKEVNERGYDWTAKPVTYVAARQINGNSPGQLVLRASVPPERLSNAVSAAIQSVDPDQPISLPRTFDEVLALDQANRRQQMFLLVAFAALSLTMAALGIYAVLAYSVEVRSREIGIRMALGAGPPRVMRLIAGDGIKLASVGGVIGVILALAGGRLIQSSLYGVKPFDALTIGIVCGVLAIVALAACWIPARRAAATAPAIALRA
jgi:predicted permease